MVDKWKKARDEKKKHVVKVEVVLIVKPEGGGNVQGRRKRRNPCLHLFFQGGSIVAELIQ